MQFAPGHSRKKEVRAEQAVLLHRTVLEALLEKVDRTVRVVQGGLDHIGLAGMEDSLRLGNNLVAVEEGLEGRRYIRQMEQEGNSLLVKGAEGDRHSLIVEDREGSLEVDSHREALQYNSC